MDDNSGDLAHRTDAIAARSAPHEVAREPSDSDGAHPPPAETKSSQMMNKADDEEPRKRRLDARKAAHQAGNAVKFVRSKIATIVRVIALICAVALALGAILAALDANPANPIVSRVTDVAQFVDGPFANMFTFSGDGSAKKEILVNWGIGAVAYLIVGRILERIIRP